MKVTFNHEVKHKDKIDTESLIKVLLKNRNIKNVDEFLNPPDPSKIDLTDFGFKTELKKTLKLLDGIKRENKMIVVYTDYDADGITGGSILWETLHHLGFKVMPYVPHRKLEGYGFSIKGIDNVKKQFDPALIISVDHGITAREKVSYAKKLGIKVIITDHHLKPEKLPDDAEAIFHIPELSGSGVAYFFSKAIFEHFSEFHLRGESWTKEHLAGVNRLKENFSCDYLALASIGSIADLVPLTNQTRSLVKYGLQAFDRCTRAGIRHILKQAGIEGKKISPYEVGFIIAPRINAVGRLEHAIDALRLLCTTSEDKAYGLASRVGVTNRERQDLVTKAVEEARLRLKASTGKQNSLPKIIILEDKHWHEGIIGLIASKITEEFYRPTIVLTQGDGFLKASARSIPSLHITNFLRDLKEYLVDVGGHKAAAGFTIEKEKYANFVKAAAKKIDKLLTDKDLERTIEADIKIPLSLLTMPIVKKLEELQPFGIGNPRPTFYSEVEILDIKLMGKTNDHLKLLVKDVFPDEPNTDYRLPIEMISFGNAKKYSDLERGQKINVAYSIDINRWNGYEKLSGKVITLIN